MAACHMAAAQIAATSAQLHRASQASGRCQLAGSSGRTPFLGAEVPACKCVAVQTAGRQRSFGLRAMAQDGAALAEDDISKTLLPAASFYKVEAIIRPWRLTYVAQALLRMGIRGVTVTDVRGFGAQGGSRERQAGSEFTDDKFVSKVKVEVVVVYEQVEEVVGCIIDEARTGEIGDGKIFVSPVSDIIRVRTGERGLQAERMAGGRMELLAGKGNGSA